MNWTLPSLNLNVSIFAKGDVITKIEIRIANSNDPDETAHYEVFGLVCMAERVILVMLNKLMPLPLLIVSQSDYLILIFYINSHTKWQTVKIQISWLLQKPTDLDLHCLQKQGLSGFSRTRVNWEHFLDISCCPLQLHSDQNVLHEIMPNEKY